MATISEQIAEFGQKVYLIQYGDLNDVDDEDEATFISNTITWVNLFLDELELEADWNFAREYDYSLGTVAAEARTFTLTDDTVKNLVFSSDCFVNIYQDGSSVASFAVVNPNQISNPSNLDPSDRVTMLGRKLIFSRPLKDTEVGGDIRADIIKFLPRLSATDATVLTQVQPLDLLVYGVAKNASIPDSVKVAISPSLAQQYANILTKAIERNSLSSVAGDAGYENLSFVAGVW